MLNTEKSILLNKLTFPISYSKGRVYAFPKRSVGGVDLRLCDLGVIEEEHEIWDNSAEGYAEKHENLVKEENVLERNAVRKYSLEDGKGGR